MNASVRSLRNSLRFKALYPKPRVSLYWLPEVGQQVILKDPIFPASYGKLAIVTKRYGFGRVRVLLEDGRSFSAAVRTLRAAKIDSSMDIG